MQPSTEPVCIGHIFAIEPKQSTIIRLNEVFTIGPQTEHNFQLNPGIASGFHAHILQKTNYYELKVYGDTKRCLLNGKSVRHAKLEDGDQIRLGIYTFYFATGDEHNVLKTRLELTSKNPIWWNQLKKLPHAAYTDFPILLRGPSGTGKEVLAQKIHNYSKRKQKPFISVNCAALSPNLIESELFGHKKGSFTGAVDDRLGAFLAANGGTLFLDEIGDLPLELQPKILRALENSEVQPVGCDRPKAIDVRIIAATHKNLESAVQSGEFRNDLYHRLNVISFNPPALKLRNEDIESLLYYFGYQYHVAFEYRCLVALKSYPWPGNIRELKNFVARAAALFPNERISVSHLPLLILRGPQSKLHKQGDAKEYLQNMERTMILERLKANNWHQRQTAMELGIPKSTFHDKIHRLGIAVPTKKIVGS